MGRGARVGTGPPLGRDVIKVGFFQRQPEHGPTVFPLFGPADPIFEKTAAPQLLPEVSRFIATLRPRDNAQYSLVNALGAGEYWGSNVNGDHFPEAALVHAPDDWTGVPVFDRTKGKTWPYGFPTFYQAKPFLHHRNKDFPPHNHPFYGEVELAAWNPKMKRDELITRVDKALCERGGGLDIWDKLKAGDFPDVSMGAKVPFDTCSICLDWKLYRQAQAAFDPKKHKHPGEAVLEVHRSTQTRQKNARGEWEWVGQGKIRGLSITRRDYCEHAKNFMNVVLPDGRKVYVYNDYPRFFDISFVFIGADKTAKVMMKVAGAGSRSYWFLPGAELADKLGYAEQEETEKVASVDDEVLKLAFGKVAKFKEGEILKRVVPSQFAAKAIPLLTKTEPDLPRPILDRLGENALRGLATSAGMGIVLRPREFQRVLLRQLGEGTLADALEERGVVFPHTPDEEPLVLSANDFSPVLARFLAPFMGARSCLGPCLEARIVVVGMSPPQKKEQASLSSELLRKIGSAYKGYRRSVMDLVPNASDLITSTTHNADLLKVAHAPITEMFTPLSATYLQTAYYDEVGVSAGAGGSHSLRGEGRPLEEHAADRIACGGHTS